MELSENIQVEHSEWKFLLLSMVIMFLLFLAINVTSINTFISSLNPIIQFLIINMGLFFTVFIVFKFIALKETAWLGSIGSFLMSISFDIMMPEYHVMKGQLIPGGVFGKSASDYFFGYIYNHFLGVNGVWLWILVYPITFSILFMVGALLFKNFVQHV